ncbi:MAG: HPr family phosphocarrier protein [Ruminococcaceae bacterium]|nr:HPr family phosphocarrier protein [Oscillospiraceae bacterium]MBD5116799.1 HPr family phosphocarrier protein [Oscillospiraceae bacterium]
MVTKTVTVVNAQGMHMRPAGLLAKAAAAHKECKVTLNVNDKSVNAKAVMQIMSACIKCGSVVEIVCDGAEEQAVLDEIAGMFEGGFGE